MDTIITDYTPENNTRNTSEKIPKADVIEACVKAKEYALGCYFSEAFNTIDTIGKKVRDNQYSDIDRKRVAATLKEILMMKYREPVIKKYEQYKSQYRQQNDDGIYFSLQYDGYPKRTGQTTEDHINSYISYLARKQINEELNTERYGGKMNAIIAEILAEYFREEREKKKKNVKKENSRGRVFIPKNPTLSVEDR